MWKSYTTPKASTNRWDGGEVTERLNYLKRSKYEICASVYLHESNNIERCNRCILMSHYIL